MQQTLQDVLAKRRDRAIAIVLSIKERECDQHLSAHASQKLRKVVLDQFNEYYDLCVDIMASLDTGEVVVNDLWIAKLDSLRSDVAEVKRLVQAS